MSGQSISDRITAAKYSISGQGLAKTVCKATTEELIAPKKKHVDYLIQCTNEPNVSIPHMANLLIERVHGQNWIIVFKSLVTIHNLVNFGNERFTQYLASNNCSFQLDNFYDKTPMSVDMSKFIRRYSKYIHQKCYSYRMEAYDFCKVKRGKDDGVLRTMTGERLLKTLPVLQQQLDALLDFDATVADLGNNSIIYACFILLFKDLIRLFACYNDGIINLLETYFEMNKKQCKEALDIYKKFLVGMDRVSTFLKLAENMGVDKGDIPDLAKAPASLLEALESHLASLEGKTTTPTGAKPAGFNHAVDNLSRNAGEGGDVSAQHISDEERRKALEEENQTISLFNQKAGSPVTAQASTNPFAISPTQASKSPIKDSSKPIDDLLGLSTMAPASTNTNPFGGPSPTSNVDLFATQPNTFNGTAFNAQATSPFNGHAFGTSGQSPFGDGAFSQPSLFGAPSNPSPSLFDAPASQSSFGSANTASTNPWNAPVATKQSPLHQPQQQMDFTNVFGEKSATSAGSGFDAFGPVMAPASTAPQPARPTSTSKLLDKDLDSSLANLVGNLGMGSGGNQVKKEHDWSSSPNRGMLTGGANWAGTGQPMAPSTLNWGQPQQPVGMMGGIARQPSPLGQAPNTMNPFQQPETTQKPTTTIDPFDSLLK